MRFLSVKFETTINNKIRATITYSYYVFWETTETQEFNSLTEAKEWVIKKRCYDQIVEDVEQGCEPNPNQNIISNTDLSKTSEAQTTETTQTSQTTETTETQIKHKKRRRHIIESDDDKPINEVMKIDETENGLTITRETPQSFKRKPHQRRV